MPHDNEVNIVESLCARIRPILAGNDPAIQGAALADLLAVWIAGYSPPLREETLRAHIDAVRSLTTINARILGDEVGLPDWDVT